MLSSFRNMSLEVVGLGPIDFLSWRVSLLDLSPQAYCRLTCSSRRIPFPAAKCKAPPGIPEGPGLRGVGMAFPHQPCLWPGSAARTVWGHWQHRSASNHRKASWAVCVSHCSILEIGRTRTHRLGAGGGPVSPAGPSRSFRDFSKFPFWG